ncbi:MAG: lycopene cyclase domain-containing protein [Polaribacter sp.]|uniref:lycopene cyclase domain-containing protein n=1 Tax=Polaribacter sp. TaxID=1920175 RepID=UPI002F35021D
MDEKYAFLYLCLSYVPIWLYIFFKRKDLRKKLIRTTIAGGVVAPFTDYFHFRDYWIPPSILNTQYAYFEDVIMGAMIISVVATIYETVFNLKLIPYKRDNKIRYTFYTMFVLSFVLVYVFTGLLEINSIFVYSSIFILYGIIMLSIRPNLLKASLISSLLSLGIQLIIYIPLFTFFAPTFWKKYYLLANTKYDVTFLNIPITEMLYFITIGFTVGIFYEFVAGRKRVSF